MSVREGLLALLVSGPKHGYQLKNDFDREVGGPKPLNVGQVYITLERLARDGLVVEVGVRGDGDASRSGAPDERRRTFELTPSGRDAARSWFSNPVANGVGARRDELVAKVVLALDVPGIDVFDVIQVERRSLVGSLQAVRRSGRGADRLSARLVDDATAARLEAEIAWLDRCEQRVREHPGAADADADPDPDEGTPTMTVLELRSVTRRYHDGAAETLALDGVSLQLQPGEFTAVMGASGSGKSTLIHVAAGLEIPDAGEVLVGGEVAGARDRARWAGLRRQRIGVVFQRLNLISVLTALENVSVPLELDGHGRRQALRDAAAALERCGVASLADRYPHDLSGGQQQRVAIARALVGKRDILLADEPTGALDSISQEQMVELLAERAGAGAAVLMVTHDSRLAAWADRVVFLRDGSIVDDGTAGRSAPATPGGAGAAVGRGATATIAPPDGREEGDDR